MTRAVPAAALLLALGLHAALCGAFFGGPQAFRTAWPTLENDFPLHAANAANTVAHFRHSGTNAGYDPSAFAGHVKTSFWPTSPQQELLTLACDGWLAPAKVSKAYSVGVAAALPWGLVLAGGLLRLPLGAVAWAVALWTAAFWQAAPFQTDVLVAFGMSAFVASVALALPAAAASLVWLERRTWRSAAGAAALLALACMAHPTVPVVLGPPLLLTFVVKAGRAPRAWGQALAICGFVALANFWWLAPLWQWRDTAAGGPAFFVNRNWDARLLDLVRPRGGKARLPGPAFFTLLLAGAAACAGRLRLAPGLCWIAALALLAGRFEAFDFLQAGRNTLHLLQWLALPGGVALAAAWRAGGWRRGLPLAALGWACATWLSEPRPGELVEILGNPDRMLSAQPRPWQTALLDRLRAARPAGRILWEACEGGQPAKEWERDHRIAPLVAGATGREVLGGPYLQAHYHVRFSTCGEGKFLRGPWTIERFDAHAAAYALDHAVLWSPNALLLALANPERFRPLGEFGPYLLYRIQRPPAPWEAAGLEVSATFNRIEVRNPRGAKGRFVLPYHWFPGFRAEPALAIHAERQGEDPVPFVTLDDPPPVVVLTWSPWRR